MKLGNIVNPDFTEAMRRLAAQRLPLKAAFKIKKLISKLDEEASVYHEVRTQALLEYASKDENGQPLIGNDGSVAMTDEDRAIFVNRVTELLDTDIEFTPLTVEELGDNVEISPQDLQMLDGIVSFEE